MLVPDILYGDPAPADLNDPGFNFTEWQQRHTPEITDPIIDNAVKYIRKEMGITRVGAVGYCFGGKYAARVLAKGRGVDVAFVAHPSNMVEDEIKSITGPFTIAAAGMLFVTTLFSLLFQNSSFRSFLISAGCRKGQSLHIRAEGLYRGSSRS